MRISGILVREQSEEATPPHQVAEASQSCLIGVSFLVLGRSSLPQIGALSAVGTTPPPPNRAGEKQRARTWNNQSPKPGREKAEGHERGTAIAFAFASRLSPSSSS